MLIRAVNKFDDRNMRKNYCARSMETLREGWPQKAALCDEIENHPFQQFCNTYDAIMHKMHDITAPIINSEANYDQDID
uniref:Bm8913 n=2 Tax=Brugia TaxID=6278 RepID=A0A0H5S438_BRUMA|nr:Bm8913 [Brugia malayi]